MVAVGHRRDPDGRPCAEARQSRGEARAGEPVGLGEEEVQPDRGRPRRADAVDEVGQELPGPGPLAVPREAPLVHGHDDGRPRDPDARRQPLAEVEPEPAQPGVGPPDQEQAGEGEEDERADDAPRRCAPDRPRSGPVPGPAPPGAPSVATRRGRSLQAVRPGARDRRTRP